MAFSLSDVFAENPIDDFSESSEWVEAYFYVSKINL